MRQGLPSAGPGGRSVRGVCGILIAVVSVMSLPAVAHGQTVQASSIIGQVTDESGAVLPGVTVTATSPSLIVQNVTFITDQRGEYHLTPLPIGVYEVSYTLSGF